MKSGFKTDWLGDAAQTPLALPVRDDLNFKRRTGQKTTAKAQGDNLLILRVNSLFDSVKCAAELFSFCVASVLIVRYESFNSFTSKRKCVLCQNRNAVPAIFANYEKGFFNVWLKNNAWYHTSRENSVYAPPCRIVPFMSLLGGSLNSNLQSLFWPHLSDKANICWEDK